MRRLIRKLILGTASVLALGIGGTALNYAADAGNAVTSESTAAAPQTVQPGGNLPHDSYWAQMQLRKDDIRWAQLELHNRGLYKGSLNGILGPQTKRALEQFQRTNGLGRTASLDAQTFDALTENSGAGTGPSAPPDTEGAGSMTNSSQASGLGR
jgi:peptidoglycan hydrolase-like protein with peptidoglycan-binding domain